MSDHIHLDKDISSILFLSKEGVCVRDLTSYLMVIVCTFRLINNFFFTKLWGAVHGVIWWSSTQKIWKENKGDFYFPLISWIKLDLLRKFILEEIQTRCPWNFAERHITLHMSYCQKFRSIQAIYLAWKIQLDSFIKNKNKSYKNKYTTSWARNSYNSAKRLIMERYALTQQRKFKLL